MKYRKVKTALKSRPTLEGAGVHLRRAFGNNEIPLFDPFLLLDDFRGDDPEKYRMGFPWHPHRGIETITYMLDGSVEHGDSMGNKGVISSGDVQWMTAGSGIIHQEMPKGDKNGAMYGFQLWANLPASHKMMPPRYRDVKSKQIPEIKNKNGVVIRIICGTVDKTSGPVKDIVTDPEYLDVSVPSNTEFIHAARQGYTVFAYVIDGEAFFDGKQKTPAGNGSIILFEDGDGIAARTEKSAIRFLLVSGKPLNEPVAWYGPIVMNTDEELRIAFEEYENGTFIKS
jgi:redox-sensitive bicupin YhaK (pirin superfamily)